MDCFRPILLHGLVETFIECDAEMKEHLINSIEEASSTSPTLPHNSSASFLWAQFRSSQLPFHLHWTVKNSKGKERE
jgi:hypothetical protein